MAEKLRLVKAWSELGAGLPIVIKGCRWCGRSHRGMLFKRIDNAELHEPNGTITRGRAPSWAYLPRASCCDDVDYSSVHESTIRERRLYRILPGLEVPALSASRSRDTRRPAKVDVDR